MKPKRAAGIHVYHVKKLKDFVTFSAFFEKYVPFMYLFFVQLTLFSTKKMHCDSKFWV